MNNINYINQSFPPLFSEADDQENDIKENLFFKREDWLKEHGRKSSDIMLDDKGQFVYVEDDPEEGRDVKKVYLPEGLQNIYL